MYPDPVWNFIMQYKNSNKEFERRIVAVMILSHYLSKDYIDKAIAILSHCHFNCLNTDNYYHSMSVAWAIASIMGKISSKMFKLSTFGKLSSQ